MAGLDKQENKYSLFKDEKELWVAVKYMIENGMLLPHSYKFLRDVYFAVFMDNVWSTKIKSPKIYNSIDTILC